MNWLITGGCGFIGTGLIEQLQRSKQGHRIRVLDNLSTGTREDLANYTAFTEKTVSQLGAEIDDVELVIGDIVDDEVAKIVTRGIDLIVHLAANTGVGPSVEDPRTDCITNVIGTLNYLEGARENNVKRFIFASSGAPVGEIDPPIHEEIPPHPVSPYGASKLAGEAYCSAYYRSFGIDTVALRFGNVYGPGSLHKNSVVARFIRQVMSGEAVEIFGDGTQTRDFIYIDDLIEALVLAATKDDIGGEIFQIATSNETTLNELLAHLIDALNEAGLPTPVVRNTEKRLGDVMRNFSDTSKAMRYLGWKSKTSLVEGLRETISYFKK